MYMASTGNVNGIVECSHREYLGDLWQEIAEVGAAYGHLDVVRAIHSFYTLNMQDIGVIARNGGHIHIASWALGSPWVPNLQGTYQEFPRNIGVDTSVPENVREWEMVDWDESFDLPDTEATPYVYEVGDPMMQPDREDRMEIPGIPSLEPPQTFLGEETNIAMHWKDYDDTLDPEMDATTMLLEGVSLQKVDDEDEYIR